LEYACPQLVPNLDARYWDRFFDVYIHGPVQRIVADRLRPEGSRDPFGVDEAKADLVKAYGIANEHFRTGTKTWATGASFTIADRAAAPPLFFANKLVPFAHFEPLAAYFDRLTKRPSYARVLTEMQPYFHMFPG